MCRSCGCLVGFFSSNRERRNIHTHSLPPLSFLSVYVCIKRIELYFVALTIPIERYVSGINQSSTILYVYYLSLLTHLTVVFRSCFYRGIRHCQARLRCPLRLRLPLDHSPLHVHLHVRRHIRSLGHHGPRRSRRARVRGGIWDTGGWMVRYLGSVRQGDH